MSRKDERLVKLGNDIKGLRKAKGFTQVRFAILLSISREHLSKIERGSTPPSVSLLFEISKLTDGEIVIKS